MEAQIHIDRTANRQSSDPQASRGRLAFDDASSPQAIRDKFGVSKNAFKQALGALYKQRRIRFLNPGIELTGKPLVPAGGR